MITYDTYVANLSFALRFNWNRMISLYFYISLSHKKSIKFNIQLFSDITVTKGRNSHFRNAIFKITFDIAKI